MADNGVSSDSNCVIEIGADWQTSVVTTDLGAGELFHDEIGVTVISGVFDDFRDVFDVFSDVFDVFRDVFDVFSDVFDVFSNVFEDMFSGDISAAFKEVIGSVVECFDALLSVTSTTCDNPDCDEEDVSLDIQDFVPFFFFISRLFVFPLL